MTDKRQPSVELNPSNLLPTKKRRTTYDNAPTVSRMNPELGGLRYKPDNRRVIRKDGVIY